MDYNCFNIFLVLLATYLIGSLMSRIVKPKPINQNPNNYKFLFIIKERSVYNTKTKAYGLFNSCKFVANKLSELSIPCEVVQVVDNNCIDKYVSMYKPTHCFIEAIWVVPSKFEVLAKIHPNVKWVVRLHSMVPFLSGEGMAFEWLNEYLKLREKGIDITISCNNKKMFDNLKTLYGDVISYTPNIYYPDIKIEKQEKNRIGDTIDVGCFGALRILKNHAQQALWAIEFANNNNKKLNFHINISEHEQKESGPVLRNLRAMFKNTNHALVEHPWYDHSEFLQVVKNMDLGMQISFTETFNITSADFVYCGVPIVVSKEIEFVHPNCRVNPTNDSQVFQAIKFALTERKISKENKMFLDNYNEEAIKDWLKFVRQN